MPREHVIILSEIRDIVMNTANVGSIYLCDKELLFSSYKQHRLYVDIIFYAV